MPKPPANDRTDTAPARRRDRRADAMTAAAIGFFLLAVGFTGWVALHSSPVLLATLMLLAGLAGVACLGLFVLRGSGEPAPEADTPPDQLLEALEEPAAVTAADGRLQAVNSAWRAALGTSPRLPKAGSAAASLFAALGAARRGEPGRAQR